MIAIGIDTGGTCTDAVVYDFSSGKVLGSGKALTTKDHLETGIANALDQLPEEIVRQAQLASLSTTLATNACLENKGARAKLLMIGFDPVMMDYLHDLYASYGLDDMTRFVVLDARVEGLYTNPYDPDWEDLREKAGEYFKDCDSVGIVQMNPKANGGRFELTARRILQDTLSVPVTISFDISRETDILKTCAGTLLNARLIPLISEFMEAVHHVLEARELYIPITIVRSDGTLMPEEMAFSYPVETILCGPSASVVGGAVLASQEDVDTDNGPSISDDSLNGIVVDMGGTTTDIALIRQGEPIMANEGICIGQWKTMVKGLFVETVALGGDSAVRYTKDGDLYLDSARVIPLSVLASQYDHVLPCLEELAEKAYFSSNQVHEFYVLVKDISQKTGYSETEQRLCGILKEKPLITMDLANRMGCYHLFLNTTRLEQDGVILKSGLTPTDMMILKGDFTLYDGAAARAGLRCLEVNTSITAQELPDRVYDLVTRKMYESIGKVLLQKQYPRLSDTFTPEYLKPILDCFYQQAKSRAAGEDKASAEKNAADTGENGSGKVPGDISECPQPDYAIPALGTGLPLIGVGAPIHVFLPRVARLLQTKALIPSHAEVANALGAAACKKTVHCELIIKADYKGPEFLGLSLYEDGKRYEFQETQEAVSFGREVMNRMLAKQAKMRGITGETEPQIHVEEYRFGHTSTGILFEIRITGSVKDPSAR